MQQPILTPLTTSAFIKRVRKAGFIERNENYPVVAEVPDGYVFVCFNDNDGTWFVNKFWLNTNDWNCQPIFECETYSGAFAYFQLEYVRQLEKRKNKLSLF
jgi:hypothetical protein